MTWQYQIFYFTCIMLFCLPSGKWVWSHSRLCLLNISIVIYVCFTILHGVIVMRGWCWFTSTTKTPSCKPQRNWPMTKAFVVRWRLRFTVGAYTDCPQVWFNLESTGISFYRDLCNLFWSRCQNSSNLRWNNNALQWTHSLLWAIFLDSPTQSWSLSH